MYKTQDNPISLKVKIFKKIEIMYNLRKCLQSHTKNLSRSVYSHIQKP